MCVRRNNTDVDTTVDFVIYWPGHITVIINTVIIIIIIIISWWRYGLSTTDGAAVSTQAKSHLCRF